MKESSKVAERILATIEFDDDLKHDDGLEFDCAEDRTSTVDTTEDEGTSKTKG